MLGNAHCKVPRVINTDKAKAFPPAFEEAKLEEILPDKTKHRRQKYLNNIQEQDHRPTKRRVRQSQWFQSFHTAKWAIDGYETMHMLRKGQVKRLALDNECTNVTFIESLFWNCCLILKSSRNILFNIVFAPEPLTLNNFFYLRIML